MNNSDEVSQLMYNLSDKEYHIHWHGCDDLSDPRIEGADVLVGKSWVDAVNKFLELRFNHGPKFFYIDYYHENLLENNDR